MRVLSSRQSNAVRWVWCMVATLFFSGCGFATVKAPLRFHADNRLTVLSPKSGASLALPATLRWRVTDFFSGVNGDHFIVYLDRFPVAPGQRIRIRTCTGHTLTMYLNHELRSCPDDTQSIFQAEATSLTFACIRPHPTGFRQYRSHHQVIVILADKDNRRVGEASALVTFSVQGAGSCEGTTIST